MEAHNKLLTVITTHTSTDKKSAKIIQEVNNTKGLRASIETGRYFIDGENIVCISSAIGCMRGCAFCATTKPYEYEKGKPLQFLRFLTAEEIVEQVINSIEAFPLSKTRTKRVLLSYTGMGEPFDNILEVKRSIKTLEKIFPQARVTLSTIAHSSGDIRKFADEVASGNYSIPIKLHISLHGSTDDQRHKLIPYASTIKKAIDLASYYKAKTGNTVKLNYVLLKNFNDSEEDAKRLGQLLTGSKSLVLKISDLNSSNKHAVVSATQARKFETIVKSFGVKTCRFYSRGQDIKAGCGELVKGAAR